MLSIDVRPVMAARGVRKVYAHLVKAGMPVTAARKLSDNTYRVVPLEHLETLCLLLKCTPNDLLVWVPDQGQIVDGQPLAALRRGRRKGAGMAGTASGIAGGQAAGAGSEAEGDGGE